MPITKVKVLREREGESRITRNNLLREVQTRQHRQDMMVWLESASMSLEDVLTDPGPAGQPIPALGDPFPGNFLATLVSKTASRTENPKLWVLHLVYDTERLIGLITDDPLQQPPEIYHSTFKYSAPLLYDILGVPVLTSAGNRYDPIPGYDWERSLITVTRNVPEFTIARKRRFNLKLNLKPIFGFPAFAGRINDIQGRRMLSNGVIFWQETLEMEFRTKPDSFFDFYLDADYRNDKGTVQVDPLTKLIYSTPTLLNGRGKPASDSRHILIQAIGPREKFYNVSASPALRNAFPPPPTDPLPNGMQGGPNNTEFVIELRGITDPTKFEIIKVSEGITTGVWVLDRGFMGSTNTDWPVGSANVSLLAYYKKYVPYQAVDWTPLDFDALFIQ